MLCKLLPDELPNLLAEIRLDLVAASLIADYFDASRRDLVNILQALGLVLLVQFKGESQNSFILVDVAIERNLLED